MLKEVSSDRKCNIRSYALVHLLYLPDSSYLATPAVVRYSQILIKWEMCEYFTDFHFREKEIIEVTIDTVLIFLSTVSLNQGFPHSTSPMLTWWIKLGNLDRGKRLTTSLKTSLSTSQRVALPTNRGNHCPGFCSMTTVHWGSCTLFQSTEGKAMPRCSSTPWPSGSELKATRCTAS